jgi:hypothetical protein
MHAAPRWNRSRYAALLLVFALHVAFVTGLIMAARARFLTTAPALPIEILNLHQNTAPTVPPPPPASGRRERVAVTSQTPPADALTVVMPNSSSEVAGPAIDWSREAHNAAASIAKRPPASSDRFPAPPSNSPFEASPSHHKGEQIPTADGRWIVYVSDDCYQVSKAITSVTNATNNGMSLQTYCTRHSKTPRGDLFNQLPAYKKLHPDK